MNNIQADTLISVSELQRHYPSLLKKAKKSGVPLWLFKKNKPTAVLLDNDLFEKIAEKARLYEEAEAQAAISGYRVEKAAGKLKKMKTLDGLFH
jgi:prevent-host-death family protein